MDRSEELRPNLIWKRAILTGCLVTFGLVLSGSAWAQLGGIVTAVPRPSAYPADWQSTPTLATMLIVASEPATCYLEVFLTSDKGTGVSTPKFQYVPTGSNNYYTQHLTNWNLHLTGKVKEGFDRTGRLPDGTYVLTAHCFNVQTVSGQPLPDLFASTTFTISVPQPPCSSVSDDRIGGHGPEPGVPVDAVAPRFGEPTGLSVPLGGVAARPDAASSDRGKLSALRDLGRERDRALLPALRAPSRGGAPVRVACPVDRAALRPAAARRDPAGRDQ